MCPHARLEALRPSTAIRSAGADVFVHISAVEKAGMLTLNEGQKISYEIATDGGRTLAANLKAVD